ncbi:MAG: universal stress protein, partial [Methanomicrobiales archaeon]|nr:universal stress protein [Methanomicrobiales archaeon]
AHLFSRILYATDFSEGSQACIPFLERMAASSAILHIAHVEDARHLGYASAAKLHNLRKKAEKELSALQDRFTHSGFSQVEVVYRRGNAISELLSLLAEKEPDLLVIGAKGTFGITERVLGGVAEALIHRSPVHVLVIR